MAKQHSSKRKLKKVIKKSGKGLLNKLIDRLPVELHVPGYQFCGPGTKLKKRLERGDEGVNPLDKLCKQHDIIYSQVSDTAGRRQADTELAQGAMKRVTAKDASLGERLAALGVAGIMTGKKKLGMGLKKGGKTKGGDLKLAPKSKILPKKRKRIIKTPKRGGFLPLLFPILGALGALGGGAAGIAKAVSDAKTNKLELEEQKRHNAAVEAAMKGKGLLKGKGIFLKYPFSKNFQ